MRMLAIICNIVLIGTVIYLLSDSSYVSDKEMALAAIFLAAPITSLFALHSMASESWIFLYFKRKALEEKKKIASMGN